MKFGNTIMQFNGISIVRFDLQEESKLCDYVAQIIFDLWMKYEPWSSFEHVRDFVTAKSGRMIDIAYDKVGKIVGFYIFRVFDSDSSKIMFRGSSYSFEHVRGIGVPLLNLTIRQFCPNKLITFTNQERVYKLLSYYGEIFPAKDRALELREIELISQLSGRKNEFDKDSMIIKNFYPHRHERQGVRVRDDNTRILFDKLNKKDAYAILVRIY